MFNDLSIVSTAVSSFNNAALYNPLFFALGLLMLPLYFIVYIYGNDFIAKIGWKKNEIENKTAFFTSLFLTLWLLIFGGNYAVIRDGISLLPLMISAVLFVLFVLIMQKSLQQKYIEKISDKKTRWFVLGGLLLLAAFSAEHTWYGILLQVSAVLCGLMVGCRIKKDIVLVPTISVILGLMTMLILMQPEYFRFGQLGNLTFVHMASILFVGFCSLNVLIPRYVDSKSKIRESAYIKLKWLFRILSILALLLFLSTESVPVFIGLMFVVSVLEMLNIYHSKSNFKSVSKKAWSLLLIGFGIITICPVISSLGIIYALSETDGLKLSDFKGLL
jgi:hypothetical protein